MSELEYSLPIGVSDQIIGSHNAGDDEIEDLEGEDEDDDEGDEDGLEKDADEENEAF